MNKKGKTIFLILVSIFLINSINAFTTVINVKTLPGHEVQATLSEASGVTFSVLEGGKFKEITDEYGDVKFTYKGDQTKFNIIFYIKNKEGDKIDLYSIDEGGEKTPEPNPYQLIDYPAGEDLELRLAPKWYDFVEAPLNNSIQNESLSSVTAPVEETDIEIIEQGASTENTPITGNSIFGEDGFFSSKIFYYLIIALGLFIVVFATAKVTQFKLSKKSPENIKVRKLSEIKKQKDDKIEKFEKIIEESEKQIKEAKEQIQKAKEAEKPQDKHKEKIEDLKKKIEDYEKELIKLRQEDKD